MINLAMKKLTHTFLFALLLLSLISCNKTAPVVTMTNLRFINLSPNSSPFDVYVNSTLIVGAVSYSVATSYIPVDASGSSFSVNQSGTSVNYLTGNISFTPNGYYSAIVYDSMAILKGNIFIDDRTAPPAGKSFVRFFDYVSGTSSLDIIRTDTGTTKLFTGRTYLDHINSSTNANFVYIPINPGSFSATAVVAGTNVQVAQLANFTAVAGKSYTIFLNGFTNGTGPQGIFLGSVNDE